MAHHPDTCTWRPDNAGGYDYQSECYLPKHDGKNKCTLHIQDCDRSQSDIQDAIEQAVEESLTVPDVNLSNLPDTSELDLSEVKFPDGNFSESDFEGMNFSGADLRDGDFEGANLTRADFISGANLTNADLTDSTCISTQFQTSELVKTEFVNAEVTSSSFQGCSATNVDFTKSTIENSDLFWSTLKSADFSDADISKTCFIESELSDSKFVESRITKSDFTGANFSEASFAGTVLDQNVEFGPKLMQEHFADRFLQSKLRDSWIWLKESISESECRFQGTLYRLSRHDMCQKLYSFISNLGASGHSIDSVNEIGRNLFKKKHDVYSVSQIDIKDIPDEPPEPYVTKYETSYVLDFLSILLVPLRYLVRIIMGAHRLLEPTYNYESINQLQSAENIHSQLRIEFRQSGVSRKVRKMVVRQNQCNRKQVQLIRPYSRQVLLRWLMLYGESPWRPIITGGIACLALTVFSLHVGVETPIGYTQLSAVLQEPYEMWPQVLELILFSAETIVYRPPDDVTLLKYHSLLTVGAVLLGKILVAVLVFTLGRRASM